MAAGNPRFCRRGMEVTCVLNTSASMLSICIVLVLCSPAVPMKASCGMGLLTSDCLQQDIFTGE